MKKCAICREQRCTEATFCHGCRKHVCARCQRIFGVHGGSSHPLPRLSGVGILAVGGRLPIVTARKLYFEISRDSYGIDPEDDKNTELRFQNWYRKRKAK